MKTTCTKWVMEKAGRSLSGFVQSAFEIQVYIAFTLFTVCILAKQFGTGRRLGLLTACGTAICGAAAVAAIAPLIKASEQETAVGAATVAVLGTIFTLIYTALYPLLELSPAGYGIFTGGTLHRWPMLLPQLLRRARKLPIWQLL
ncbi:putative sulfate exporter family transporter [Paenibacillus sp. S150]|uniref:putative sulfate exporter family transporter n=1 Tax=Paenibacillus sp. S150 TaxID=2749826 RepID=UPI001C57FCC4|nr:putative sulfate exporter family transporter [Paenibacillus sp. S150]MBW4080749.1 putative sulfate exporter family transporter [Paenibacillus sp. S150]